MKTTVNFRVTYDVKEQLEFLAEEEGSSISDVVREIIIQHLREQGLIEAQTERVIEIDLSQVNFRSINYNTENYE
ncbi:ribbon-helix-helix protein, CopG family [Mesoflavibacter sp.]|uniref:ribbon-helix-helix protein, CopG family n=1 Tax=Mesoflavibacter sp. TaxID=1930902 RepID=UPI003517B0FC|tara:strand:- start:292 stop:516 length:225 start_codon:yes stop_codon:yes gene_type:complete